MREENKECNLMTSHDLFNDCIYVRDHGKKTKSEERKEKIKNAINEIKERGIREYISRYISDKKYQDARMEDMKEYLEYDKTLPDEAIVIEDDRDQTRYMIQTVDGPMIRTEQKIKPKNYGIYSHVKHKLGIPDSSVNMKGYMYVNNDTIEDRMIYVDITHDTYKGLDSIKGVKDPGVEEFNGFIRNGENRFEPFHHFRKINSEYELNLYEELEDQFYFDSKFIVIKHLMNDANEGLEME